MKLDEIISLALRSKLKMKEAMTLAWHAGKIEGVNEQLAREEKARKEREARDKEPKKAFEGFKY